MVYYFDIHMKVQKFGAKSATADSCFGLIGPCQCSAALGRPATSTEDLRHQGALSKPGVLKHMWVLQKLSNFFIQPKLGFVKAQWDCLIHPQVQQNNPEAQTPKPNWQLRSLPG